MKQRVVRVDPLCAARVAALFTFLVGLAVLPFLYLAFVGEPERIGFSLTVVLLMPVMLSGLGFALAAVGCVLFNWLAGRFGGLEIELREVGEVSRPCLSNRLVKLGMAGLVVGTGPLLAIIAAAEIGLWPDPNPNPIGPGILAFLTFWPSLVLIAVGVLQVRAQPLEARSGQPTLERFLLVAGILLLVAFVAVLILQPSAVGRGGR